MSDHGPSTPVCGAPMEWLDISCFFPVDDDDARCYLHDGSDAHPEADPVAFLDRASGEPPSWLRESVRADRTDQGPVLAEHFVSYSRQLADPEWAARLAVLETECHSLLVSLSDEGFYTEATEERPGKLRPAVQTLPRKMRQLRLARREAGLTFHEEPTEPELDLPW